MPRRDAPDLGALDRFLVASPPTAPDGRILSWLGPDAYPYDEATALLARHYAWSDQPSRLTRLVGVLEGRVALSGGLGRDGVLYAFDTALALPVLGAGRTRARDLVLALFEDAAAARPISAPERWSEAFGPHLLKAFAALTPAERPPHLVNRFAALAGRCQADGAFRAHPERPGVYLHAHCYATEGLLGLTGLTPAVHAAVEWLAEQVEGDGGLPAWVDAPSDRRPADVVAQAARLFAVVDPRRYQAPLQRTLGRLAALQDPVSGGIRYVEGGPHINVWASIFAHQAVRLAQGATGPLPPLV